MGLLCQHLEVDQGQALSLISESVSIAKRARARFLADKTSGEGVPLVAGSVGPYGACLHDRSEYTGDYMDHMTREELKAWHRPRVAALLGAGVDLLAVETIPAKVSAVVWLPDVLIKGAISFNGHLGANQ